MDSHVRPQSPRLNAPTEMFLPGHGPAARAPDLRTAYTFAKEALRLQPDELRGRPGHRLFWVSEQGWGCRSMVAHPDAFVIAGRHSCCAVLLPDDPSVSLRHLLVRSISLPTGGTAVRILDLHSEHGFGLVDGSRQTSVVAQGPVAISVGAYALVALPGEAALPAALPVADVTPCSADGGPYRASGRTGFESRITLMPRLVTLGEAPPPRLDRLVRGGGFVVTLERDGRAAATRLSDADLLGGVVIGRSEKCHSESLRRITANGTSRLHCLLLRDGDGIHAYDLASTQGTYHQGALVRRVLLGHRTELRLGQGASSVRMLWEVG